MKIAIFKRLDTGMQNIHNINQIISFTARNFICPPAHENIFTTAQFKLQLPVFHEPIEIRFLHVCIIGNIIQFKTVVLINMMHIQMLRKIVAVCLENLEPVATTTTADVTNTTKTTQATTDEV